MNSESKHHILTIHLECGAKTCASAPGNFCKFVKTKRFGTEFWCSFFDETLSDSGDPVGWLKRLDVCLEHEKNNAKV